MAAAITLEGTNDLDAANPELLCPSSPAGLSGPPAPAVARQVPGQISVRTTTAVPPDPREAPMRHVHHSIDYVEIYVGDVSAAKSFYGDAFGWQFNDYGETYAGIRAPGGDGEVGGITVGDARGAGPLVLVISDDLGTSLDAVRSAGGQVVEGPFDYPGGRRFHFRDPSGNVLGVFEPSKA